MNQNDRQLSPPPRPDVPALVIGQGMTMLGVLRGLGEAGIRAFATDEPGDSTSWSRWFRRHPGPPLAWDTPDALAASLRQSPLERAVIIACADSAAVAVASLPADLRERFPASCSPPVVQALLANKLHFARVLAELDVPHPETLEITSREVIAAMPEERLAGYFLKPLDSERFNRRYGIKACLLEGKDHALRKHAWLERDGQGVVLQEYIPGPPSRHVFIDGFVDRHGRVRARFARRRLRIQPPAVGNSSCLVSIPVAEVDDARAGLDRLLAHLAFRGIFSAEFKRDPRDGVCKLLEVNARPWWFIGFARLCGINVAAMAYHDALGHEVPEVDGYPVGRWCVNPRADLKASFREWRAGQLDKGSWLRAWLRGSRPVFEWRDPGPAVYEWLQIPPQIVRKLTSGRRKK